jgi:large subunit ribosomal protein L3
MLDSIFATKLDMTQAWSKQGKRLAVTRCRADDNLVVDQKSTNLFEVGYGQKKLKNMSKPLRSKMQKGGFSIGVTQLKGVKQSTLSNKDEAENDNADQIKIGDVVKVGQVLEVGDVVKVQGTTKGRGFTGVMKRWGFSGGQRTHGQSDRERAPGSIGAGTDPGRVWPGKKMPGHYGTDTKTISGLVVVYLDPETGEVWLSGPVPGFYSSTVKITKTGDKKMIELDNDASGIVVKATKEEATSKVETKEEEAKS